MKRLVLPLLLAVAPPLAAQQAPQAAALSGAFTLAFRLQLPIEIREPTIVVLVDLDSSMLVTDEVRNAAALGDSIAKALDKNNGYRTVVRSTSHGGIFDPASNASYQASPERGPGILVIVPGRRPSRLLPYLTRSDLLLEIVEYEKPFRPLQPL